MKNKFDGEEYYDSLRKDALKVKNEIKKGLKTKKRNHKGIEGQKNDRVQNK
jgi:hypothetical protein